MSFVGAVPHSKIFIIRRINKGWVLLWKTIENIEPSYLMLPPCKMITGFSVHQIYKGKPTQVPIVKATDYLHDGEYRLDYALRKAGELPEPNKGYLLEYVRTLKLRGRKARTMARRIHEIKYVLTLLGKDAKTATRRDIEDLILKLNESSMASTSRGITKLSLKNFFRFLFNSEDDPDTYPPLVRWIKVDKGNKGGKVAR